MRVPRNTVKICRNLMLSSGAVAGTAYVLQQAGVWGTPEETVNLFGRMKKRLEPHTKKIKDNMPEQMAMISKVGGFREGMRCLYNQGVKESIHFLETFPAQAEDFGKFLFGTINEKRLKLLELSKIMATRDKVFNEKEQIIENMIIEKTHDNENELNEIKDSTLVNEIGDVELGEQIEINHEKIVLLSSCF